MNKNEIFQTWAPEESPWSPWAKPVLFAHLDLSREPVTETAGNADWAPPAAEKMALVLDLPGAEGVVAGIALAGRGYRPVPLYNAVPLPHGELAVDPTSGREVAAVNVLPILDALKAGTGKLAEAMLPPDAPPAFLLDSNRQGNGRRIERGEFDNRSITFTTDFPSAIFMGSHGIWRVLVVQRDRAEVAADLAHPLRRWQDGGITLERLRLDAPGPAEAFEMARPTWYGAMFQRWLCQIGLQRWTGGGFGGWLPDSPSGG